MWTRGKNIPDLENRLHFQGIKKDFLFFFFIYTITSNINLYYKKQK